MSSSDFVIITLFLLQNISIVTSEGEKANVKTTYNLRSKVKSFQSENLDLVLEIMYFCNFETLVVGPLKNSV